VKPVNYYKGNICASSTVRKPRENGGLDFYYSRLEIGRFSCNFDFPFITSFYYVNFG
jgi:hypothetical protein